MNLCKRSGQCSSTEDSLITAGSIFLEAHSFEKQSSNISVERGLNDHPERCNRLPRRFAGSLFKPVVRNPLNVFSKKWRCNVIAN